MHSDPFITSVSVSAWCLSCCWMNVKGEKRQLCIWWGDRAQWADLGSGNGLLYGTWAVPSFSSLLGWLGGCHYSGDLLIPTISPFQFSFLSLHLSLDSPTLKWELMQDPAHQSEDTSFHSSSIPPLTFVVTTSRRKLSLSPFYRMSRFRRQLWEDIGTHRQNILNPRAIVHQLCSFHWEKIQFFILPRAPVFLSVFPVIWLFYIF